MQEKSINIGHRSVGEEQNTYVIAEIGINHNGDIAVAKELIDAAHRCGCDAVKFQKRNPEMCVPIEMRDRMRDTPWGYITYMEYRYKMEFGKEEFSEIDEHCKEVGIDWFASSWDVDSVDFLEAFSPIMHKIGSASLTDQELLDRVRNTGRPVILSTGMSTMEQIRAAVDTLGTENTLLAHCTSTYPCPKAELNLNMITTLKNEFGCIIGYSGHEVGLSTSVTAVALGATFIERHITLDRAMWGSDQSASVEPGGLSRLVKDIRGMKIALGDGVKQVYPSEVDAMKRLRVRDTLTLR